MARYLVDKKKENICRGWRVVLCGTSVCVGDTFVVFVLPAMCLTISPISRLLSSTEREGATYLLYPKAGYHEQIH